MRLTRTHLLFWQSRHAIPKWIERIEKRPTAPTIDDCIAAHAGDARRTDGEMAAHNLLNVVRMARKRNPNILPELIRIAREPGTVIDPRKRSAFAWKWSLRIVRQRIDASESILAKDLADRLMVECGSRENATAILGRFLGGMPYNERHQLVFDTLYELWGIRNDGN